MFVVDCSSTAVEAIDFLNEKKIDVLVLDHHQVSVPPPNPVAMVNPQLSDDYPTFREAFVGLAFKLAHAIVKRGRQEGLQNGVTSTSRNTSTSSRLAPWPTSCR